MKVTLTIAGSDSGGGAGIQADLKTFQELGIFGTSVITAVTAQNTHSIYAIEPIHAKVIAQQIKAILEDFKVSAIKTGMLYSTDIIDTVAYQLMPYQKFLVVDPVMVSKSGSSLLDEKAITTFKQKIFPLATLLTPNIPEAEVLTGHEIKTEQNIIEAAKALQNFGVKNIIIKGGHAIGNNLAKDYIFLAEKQYYLSTPKIQTMNTHGTGCTFSAAITAFLAKEYDLLKAIIEAKRFIQMAIENPIHVGHGYGPTNHFAYQKINPKCQVDIHEF